MFSSHWHQLKELTPLILKSGPERLVEFVKSLIFDVVNGLSCYHQSNKLWHLFVLLIIVGHYFLADFDHMVNYQMLNLLLEIFINLGFFCELLLWILIVKFFVEKLLRLEEQLIEHGRHEVKFRDFCCFYRVIDHRWNKFLYFVVERLNSLFVNFIIETLLSVSVLLGELLKNLIKSG